MQAILNLKIISRSDWSWCAVKMVAVPLITCLVQLDIELNWGELEIQQAFKLQGVSKFVHHIISTVQDVTMSLYPPSGGLVDSSVIYWMSPFVILGLLGLCSHFYSAFDGNSSWQTVQILVRCHIMWCLIWVFVFACDPFAGFMVRMG